MDNPSLSVNEVGLFAIKWLGIQDKKTCRSVCKIWKQFTDTTLKFSPVLSDETKGAVLQFGLTRNPIETLTITDLTSFTYPPNGIGFPKVNKIAFDYAGSPYRVSQLSHETMQKLLEEFHDVEILVLIGCSLRAIHSPSCLMNVPLNNLHSLEIGASTAHKNGFYVCGDVLHNNFPNLRSAQISFSKYTMIEPYFLPAFYVDIYRFVARHSKTLKKAWLFSSISEDEGRLLPGRFPAIPEDELKLIMDGLKEVQLSEIRSEGSSSVEMTPLNFPKQLLEAQKTLAKMDIYSIKESTWELWESLPQVFQQCSDTLKYVKVQGFLATRDGNGVGAIFPCSNIADCSNLEVFRLEMCGVRIAKIDNLPKQIKELHLGFMLTRSQIDYISFKMTNLETLHLPQAIPQTRYVDNYLVPKIDISIVRQVLKMSGITRLKLNKQTSEFDFIMRWVDHFAPGGMKLNNEFSLDFDYPFDLSFKMMEIDRTKFDPNQL